MHYLKKNTFLLLASLLLAASANAATEAETKSLLTSRIQEVLGGDVEINSITQTPVKALYEIVFNNGKVVYMSEEGRYVFEGDLMDLAERQNLTENRRTEARAIGLENYDRSKLIEYAPEETKHVLYVYTDIDCGYCRKFHNQIKTLNENGIAVRYFAFPRAGLNSSAYVAAESAWCADDKKTALTKAKAGESIAPAVCDDRVAQQYELGKSMGVSGTPAVYTASGKEIGGFIPAQELIQLLNANL